MSPFFRGVGLGVFVALGAAVSARVWAAPVIPIPSERGMRAAADDLRAVQEVIGKVMKLKPEFVKPSAKLIELQMTNLDYSDALEMLETKLKITISKRALQKAAGAAEPGDVVEKLTVGKLVEVINAIPSKK